MTGHDRHGARELLRRTAAEVRQPFAGGRTALWDLLAGSRALARRWWTWAFAPAAWEQRRERLGASLGIAVVGGFLAHRYAVVAVPAGLCAWCVAALVLAPPRPVAKTAPVPEPESAEAPDAVEPPKAREPVDFGPLVVAAVADAEAAGRKGIHLSTLLDHLRPHGLPADWSVTELREWCEASGIPVRRNLKIQGVGNAYGVRVDDLSAALGRPLPEAVTALSRKAAEAPAQAPAERPPDHSPEPVP